MKTLRFFIVITTTASLYLQVIYSYMTKGSNINNLGNKKCVMNSNGNNNECDVAIIGAG
jgi:hypothetical protein